MAGKQRNSYFSEMRGQRNDPNFFERISIDELRKSVKRIVKDVKYDNIAQADYMYFRNPNILSACKTESYEQWIAASVLVNALNYYINVGLKSGFAMFSTTDVNAEMVRAMNEQLKQNSRCYIWMTIYNIFNAIYNGVEPAVALKEIQNMKFNVNDL